MSNKIYFVCQHCHLRSDGFDAHELGCDVECNTPAIHFILTRVDEEEFFGLCDYCNDLVVTGYKVQESACYKVQETAW